jgi:primosomal replication protein N
VSANAVVLTACIAEVQTLRYTPAGIPALQLVLEHQSEVQDVQGKRQIKMVLKAMAFGALAERLASQAVGSNWNFQGYLSNSRAGKSVVLQIQDFSQDLL